MRFSIVKLVSLTIGCGNVVNLLLVRLSFFICVSAAIDSGSVVSLLPPAFSAVNPAKAPSVSGSAVSWLHRDAALAYVTSRVTQCFKLVAVLTT